MENISIVLPCYNHGKYVAEAIQSVLNQTYKDFKLYVFDNGSEDNAWEEISKFTDSRIEKIRLEKNNLMEVKKRFIEISKGNYIAIMHADDLWLENKLQRQMEFFSQHPDESVTVTWSKRIEIDEEGRHIEERDEILSWPNVPKDEWYRRFFIGENRVSLPSLVCKKTIYVSFFNRVYPYRQVADMFTWMKILEVADINMIEEVLVVQRLHHSGGADENESYPSSTNIARAGLELKYSRYQCIDEMPDEIFLKYIYGMFDEKSEIIHMDVMCKKLLFFARDPRGVVDGYENAIRYYDTYFYYEEDGMLFYQYLEKKYNFSREEFYKLEDYAAIDYRIKYEFRCELKTIREIQDKNLAIIWREIPKLWERVNSLDEDVYARFRFPWNLVSAGQKIVIYGGGVVGKAFIGQIGNSSYCHLVAVCDRSPKKTGIVKVPVISIDALVALDESKYDMVLIAIENEKIAGEISKSLKTSGIPESKIKWIDPRV